MPKKKKYSSKEQQTWMRKHLRECGDCDAISIECMVVAWDAALKTNEPVVSKQIQQDRRVAEQKQRYSEMLKKSAGDFSVPSHLFREFAFDLDNGLRFCMKKYGASKEQIITEAKRIVPSKDISLLRN